MANNKVALFGGMTTQQGQALSTPVARATKREIEQTAARAEIAAVQEQAHAFLASVAMSHVSVLVNQAETHVKTNPATAHFMEQIISGYAIGAGMRLNREL